MVEWKWNNYNQINYISIPFWEQMGVVTAFTAKMGGVSKNEFTSLNMGLHVGDVQEDVIENRTLIMNSLEASVDNMVCSEQVHSTKVAIINNDNMGCGAYDYSTVLKGVDAMVTNVPGVFLTTFYADCYPLYFFEPNKRVIGLAHSGWKGTMGKIGVKTIQAMGDEYKVKKEDILVFIGPGIGKCCFEIDEKLAAEVKGEFAGLNNILSANEKGFFWDLEKTNRQVLIENGIKENHIIGCNLCTSCQNNDFYSYRRDKGKTGRMAAIISLSY